MKTLILLLSILITSLSFSQEYEDTLSYSNINESNSFLNDTTLYSDSDTTSYNDSYSDYESDTSKITLPNSVIKTEPLTEANFNVTNTKTNKSNTVINTISNEANIIGSQYKYQVINQVRSNLTPNQQREVMVVQSLFRGIRR